MAALMTTSTDLLETQDFTELLDRMQPEILAFARRRVGPDRAEEVLSDVHLAALQAHRTGKHLTAGWLMVVTRNKVVDVWRREDRAGRLKARLRSECPLFTTDAEQFEISEVAVALRRLRPKQQAMLVQHYVNGEPVGNLASANGVSYKAMESAMARARGALRETYRCTLGPATA